MAAVKIKKTRTPPLPIKLDSYILFGKYQGNTIADILHDKQWISWYCQKTNSTLMPEVHAAITHHQYLSQ